MMFNMALLKPLDDVPKKILELFRLLTIPCVQDHQASGLVC